MVMAENIRPGQGSEPTPDAMNLSISRDLHLRKIHTTSLPQDRTVSGTDSGDEEVEGDEDKDRYDEEEEDEEEEDEEEEDEAWIPQNYLYSPDMEQLAITHPLMQAWFKFSSQFFDIIEAHKPLRPVSATPAALILPEEYISDGQEPIFIVYLNHHDITDRFDRRVDAEIRVLIDRYVPPQNEYSIPVRYYELKISPLSFRGIDRTTYEPQPSPLETWSRHDHGVSHMGHSLAPQHSMNNGTIFGFVRLKGKDGKEKPGVYAITCHHIAVNKDESTSVTAGDPSLRQMQSPSMQDHHTTLQTFMAEMDGNYNTLCRHRNDAEVLSNTVSPPLVTSYVACFKVVKYVADMFFPLFSGRITEGKDPEISTTFEFRYFFWGDYMDLRYR